MSSNLKHPSINALLLDANRGESPEDVIRRKCRDIVYKSKKYGWIGPAFDPKILASIRGIKVKASDTLPHEGLLVPTTPHPVIYYNSTSILERQNFTICHELAHTCFPDAYTCVRRFTESKDKFEKLCDIGAGELLMPYEEFSYDLNAAPLTLFLAYSLHKRYIASIEAVFYRIFDLVSHPVCPVYSSFSNGKYGGKFFKFNYVPKNKLFREYVRDVNCPKNSVVYAATNIPIQYETLPKETWWINGKPRSYYVESMLLPKIEVCNYSEVITLLHAKNPIFNFRKQQIHDKS